MCEKTFIWVIFMMQAAYYNIMMCAGRVEVKLRQSEVEGYERKLKEKETEVDHLKEKLKRQEQSLQELEDQSRRASKFKMQASSSTYQYAYTHMQCRNEMEEYETAHSISKLYVENLEYRMQLAMADSQKCALESEMQALIREVASLKTVQTLLQQKIEKVCESGGCMTWLPNEIQIPFCLLHSQNQSQDQSQDQD